MKRRAALLALAAAAVLQIAVTAPAYGVDPMMHSSASVESNLYGVWGENFTCSTCHKSTLTGGNAKMIAPVVQNRTVNFTTYLSYGEDTGHTTSDKICEVCHTQTSHHRYDNSVNGANHHNTVNCTGCHKHNKGFRKGLSDSPGGEACDGCHSDLYVNTYGWGMHATSQISYKHYMDNALTEDPSGLNGEKVGTSWYSTDLPNGTDAATIKARRCLMCHVDHDQFNKNRAANLRPNATKAPKDGGVSRDDTLCLSCHNDRKTKAYLGPNGEATVLAIPFPTITYNNATTVLNNTTHGYPIESTYRDGSKFSSVCSKCHNDSIGRNGENWKSFVGGLGYGQRSTFKFGEHNSTVPGRLAIFSNEFYQRVPGDGTTLTLLPGEQSITVGPTSPGWAADAFKGHYLVVTAGGGSNQRTLITANTANKIYVQTWPTGIADKSSSFDIVDDNISIDNTCFNCHSRSGQGKPGADSKDWYGQQNMSDPLVKIYDLFVGDTGTQPASVTHKTSMTVYLKLGTWNATAGSSTCITGYTLKAPGGRRIITGISAPAASGNPTYPYSYTVSFNTYMNSTPGEVEIIKPASHPLDTFARHESDERSNPDIGWNVGDQGTTTGTHLSTGATQITDSTKTWNGSEYAGQKITFPALFDGNGKQKTAVINGGAAGTVTFSPAIDGLDPAGGDNYYIGNRHVSCADCHNPHASFKNPEGKITSASPTSITDSSLVNVQGWYDGIWVGYLLKVRTALGAEQIRYITGFNKGNGTYTVSLPFNTTPAQNDNYEVLMGDKWTAVDGQSGGRAGSGSSGMWGVIPTGWRKPTSYGNMTGVVGMRRIENVFDNLSATGLRGSKIAGQRDLCVRCHSSFAFRQTPPMTPSGGPGAGSYARSTDVVDEFNPNNQAHHAVYSRGRNQPIVATGDVTGAASTYNPYWPAFGALGAAPYTKANLGAANDTTKTVSVDNQGVATFNVNLPGTVQPGWVIYINAAAGGTTAPWTVLAQGATKGWFEVVSVDGPAKLTLSPKPTKAGGYSGSYFKLTAGLGNNFVPPYGPWSILRCTDCHGSTKTDPVGPHASVNKWLVKSLDVDLSFDWYDGSTTGTGIATRKPNAGAVAAIFCFNCHRRDVYGDANSYSDTTGTNLTNPIAYRSFSRAVHSGPSNGHPDGLGLKGMFNDDSRTVDPSYLAWKDISCRHCHVGDKVGGIHGTNALATGAGVPNKGQGKRFMNGASWNGYNNPASGVVTCYTQTSANSVSSCAPRNVVSATTPVIYNYTSARY